MLSIAALWTGPMASYILPVAHSPYIEIDVHSILNVLSVSMPRSFVNLIDKAQLRKCPCVIGLQAEPVGHFLT